MAKIVRLWIREGAPPKAVARDATRPPGPGRLVDVEARSAEAARATYALSQAPEPSEEQDPHGWLAWRAAQRAVREVSRA